MIGGLQGWPLVTVIVAAIVVAGFLLVLVIIREGKSRTVRVGVFVERETIPDPSPNEDTPEWPVRQEK